jgi:hypothetical protein
MKKLLISAVAAAVLGLTTFQASAYQRWFDLVNDTGSTIVSVRATNIDDPSFHGRDLLGDYIVRPGQHMRIEPVRTQGYCRFDLELTFDNGARQSIWDSQSVRSHPGGDPRRGRSLRGLTSGNDEACRGGFQTRPYEWAARYCQSRAGEFRSTENNNVQTHISSRRRVPRRRCVDRQYRLLVAERDRSPDVRMDAQRHRLDLDLRSVMSGQFVILFRRGEACLALLPHPVLWIEGDACVAPSEKFCVIPAL